MSSMLSTDFTDVLFNEISPNNHQQNAIGIIQLNRPQVLNALTREMFIAISQKLEEWLKLSKIKAILIESSSNRAFCAGGDIRTLYEHKAFFQGNQFNQNNFNPFFKDEYQVNHMIYHCPKPYIALLNGLTMGGGAGLSIPGRWKVATENFSFAMPETKIGFFPDVGMGYFLANLPFGIGYYLGLTGETINATEALTLGLIDAIIPSRELHLFRKDLIETLVENSTDTAIYDLITQYKQPLANIKSPLIDQYELIEQHFKASSAEQIISTLSQSPDAWCQEVAKKLLQRSPTSLKITLKHLHRCEEFTFGEVIAEDGQLANKFLRGNDFYEGIRALIIDKDQQPHWQPSSLAEVSPELVNHYFEE